MRVLGTCAVVFCSFALPATAGAVVYPVTNTADAGGGSLRQAIQMANASAAVADVIRIDVTGTVNLATPLDTLQGELEIRGPGAGQFTVRRGTTAVGTFRIFKVMGSAEVEISRVTVTNGRVTPASPPPNSGGGIENEGTLSLREVVVSDNTVTEFAQAFGGGIASSGELTLVGSTVSENEASGENAMGFAAASGGGIHNTGMLSLQDSTVSDNSASATVAPGHSASASGGGINSSTSLTIDRSTVSGNTALLSMSSGSPDASGGGIDASGSALTIQRSTVSGNQAVASGAGAPDLMGGGIFEITGSTNVNSVTVAGNRAFEGANLWGNPTLQNTIIAAPGLGPNCEVIGSPDSQGHNLEDANSCGLTEPTDLTGTDPTLGPLGDNGGPTETHELIQGSPAIDRGRAAGLTTDQRGLPRPSDFTEIANAADGSDIGAFEVQAPPPSPPDTSITLLLDAKRKQKVRKLTVTVGCGSEACEAELGGKAVATKAKGGKRTRRASAAKTKRKKTFTVKPKSLSIAAGEQETKRVKFKRSKKSVSVLRRLLKRRAYRRGTKAKLKVTATDAAGNSATERVKVKLRR
jgi:hypothetical protein